MGRQITSVLIINSLRKSHKKYKQFVRTLVFGTFFDWFPFSSWNIPNSELFHAKVLIEKIKNNF